MFLVLFSFSLLFANIYCFIKKKYIYLFVPCMLFLPDYYGIEISNSLPLITVTRIMFVVLYLYAFTNRKRYISLKSFALCKISKEYYFLIAYFILRIISNLYYVFTNLQSVKTIFSIIFEQGLLLIAIYILNLSKNEIDTLIKSIVWSSFSLFIIGIFESFTNCRIFGSLYTVSREMLNIFYIRLGLLRATTTMSMPGFYGNMCLLILPLVLYLHKLTKQKKYLIICFFSILAIIHSGCRSDMIFVVLIFLIYLLLQWSDKVLRREIIKSFLLILALLSIWITTFSIFSPKYQYFYVGNMKSVLNSVGFQFDLDYGAPEGSGGYGFNSDGTGSRLTQLTALKFVANNNPIWGLGAGAQNRNVIHYYWHNRPAILDTYDMGIIESICDEGIIGFIGLIMLIVFMYLTSHNNIFYRLALIAYLLSTLSTLNMYHYCFTYIILFGIHQNIVTDSN